MIGLDHAVIVDVKATTAVRQAKVTAQGRMIERTRERGGLRSEWLVAAGGYGDAASRLACRGAWHRSPPPSWCSTNPPVVTTLSSALTSSSVTRIDSYVCPAGNRLRSRNRNFTQPHLLADADGPVRYRAAIRTAAAAISSRDARPTCLPGR